MASSPSMLVELSRLSVASPPKTPQAQIIKYAKYSSPELQASGRVCPEQATDYVRAALCRPLEAAGDIQKLRCRPFKLARKTKPTGPLAFEASKAAPPAGRKSLCVSEADFLEMIASAGTKVRVTKVTARPKRRARKVTRTFTVYRDNPIAAANASKSPHRRRRSANPLWATPRTFRGELSSMR